MPNRTRRWHQLGAFGSITQSPQKKKKGLLLRFVWGTLKIGATRRDTKRRIGRAKERIRVSPIMILELMSVKQVVHKTVWKRILFRLSLPEHGWRWTLPILIKTCITLNILNPSFLLLTGNLHPLSHGPLLHPSTQSPPFKSHHPLTLLFSH